MFTAEDGADGDRGPPGAAGSGTSEYDYIYVSTASVTVSNTTTETSIIGSGVGSLTLPANYLTAGKLIRVQAGGTITFPSGTDTITWKLKIGGTIVVQVGAIDPSAGAVTDGGWTFEAWMTCRTIGSSGTVQPHSFAIWRSDGGTTGSVRMGQDNFNSAATINTTVSNALDLTFTWSSSVATRTLVCNTFLAEGLGT
jgi:hypothetical protein